MAGAPAAWAGRRAPPPPRHGLAVGLGSLGHERVGHRGDLGVEEPGGALGVDAVDDRIEPAHRVGTAGRGVVLGGVVEGLDERAYGGVGPQTLAPGLLQRVLGEQRAGADGGVAALLVVAAGDVVTEDPAGAGTGGG